VIAFYIIALFWLVHRRVFRHVAGHRDSLAWWNFAFLATITVMPFTSNLLGEYPGNPLAVDIFAVNLLLAVLATRVMFEVGRRVGLMAGDIDAREARVLRARAAGTVIVVAVSVGLAWVNPDAANILLGAHPRRGVDRGAPVRTPRLTQRPAGRGWPIAGRQRSDAPLSG